MKKLLVTLLLAAMTVSVFTGCGDDAGKDGSSSQSGGGAKQFTVN